MLKGKLTSSVLWLVSGPPRCWVPWPVVLCQRNAGKALRQASVLTRRGAPFFVASSLARLNLVSLIFPYIQYTAHLQSYILLMPAFSYTA